MRSKASFCLKYGRYLAMCEYCREGSNREEQVEGDGKGG